MATKQKQSITQTGLVWVWITIAILALDQITKLLAIKLLLPYQPVSVIPFFNFTLAFNTGAAFNFLSSQDGWQRWFLVMVAMAVSMALLIWLYKTPRKQYLQNIAITLILGGALGNLWDRITLGYVIDFLDFYIKDWHWPAFNIADAAICTGAFMLVIDIIFNKQK